MLELSRDEIIKQLRRARLFTGKYRHARTYPIDSINKNHLMYWKNLQLFDFKENPVQGGSYHNSGSELSRAISLDINLGKLTKKYGDCPVTIPHPHIKLCRGEPPKIQEYDEQVLSEEELEFWTIKTVTRTYTTATAKAINLPPQLPLKDVFRHHVESNISLIQLKLEQIEHPDMYGYKMEIPGTDYIIKFFITGSIYSITVHNPTSIQDILKMNHWASIELKDIVEKASICRKVEREYEPDCDEPESTTTYECTI